MLGARAMTPPPKPGWLVRLALSPRFHALAERIPLLNRLTRREGRALFDIVAGFVRSQVLLALVDLNILDRLADGPATLAALSFQCRVEPERLAVLLQAAAALKLVRAKGKTWHLSPRGAAFVAVPGLALMVRHHRVLYGDLSDPAAFFRGGASPELARFWPYVFGAGGDVDQGLATQFSHLMAESQALVAGDRLRLVDLSSVRHLMDVGGGTGAFLSAEGRAHPVLRMTLFDLPDVVAGAPAALGTLAARVTICPGNFQSDPLPAGADAVSLVRVLYDHADATVDRLLAAIARSLPPGGRLVVSEPMSGGARPDPATDGYLAIYTLAMETRRTRTAADIAGRMTAVVQVRHSGVSTGTEKLFWQGTMPPFPGMGYPLVPGYESFGDVVEAGADSGFRIGESVFVPGADCYEGGVRGLFGGAAQTPVTPAAGGPATTVREVNPARREGAKGCACIDPADDPKRNYHTIYDA